MKITVGEMVFTAHPMKNITEFELGLCAGSIMLELAGGFREDHYETDIEGVFAIEAQCGDKWFSFETFDFKNFELI